MNHRIIIVGFMGCGKTTVAEALARQLRCDSIDLDSFIAELEGHSPAEIIKQDGEPAFRQIETDALRDVLEKKKARVIALGGGAWTIEANRALITQHDCLSIWLDAPFELCWERISSGNTIRPMAPDRENAKRLFESRRVIYRLADFKITLPGQGSIGEIATEIHSRLQASTTAEGATIRDKA
jgi:shikimate kinase